MTFAIAFPNIDPVIFHLGPLAVRWYSLAYIAGLVLGWLYVRRLAAIAPAICDRLAVDDFLTWATVGVVVGGRLGQVFLYTPGYYFAYPWKIIAVWEGGMSFHGGFIGVVVAGILFTRKRGIDPLRFGDLLGAAAPIGLFFGRIANFINGELWGRVSDVPWAVVFPTGGPVPRHPSQIYEACMEGAALFLILAWLSTSERIRAMPGFRMGTFIAGYGIFRAVGEMFREPEPGMDLMIFGTTYGQWLSAPMILLGLWFCLRAARKTKLRRSRHG